MPDDLVRTCASERKLRPRFTATVERLEQRVTLSTLPFHLTISDPQHEFAKFPAVAAALSIAQKTLSGLFLGKGSIEVTVEPNDQSNRGAGGPQAVVVVGKQNGLTLLETGPEAEALTGNDPNQAKPDIVVQFNTVTFLPALPTGTGGAADMADVIEHEVIHGLGFSGYRVVSGTQYGKLISTSETLYDSFSKLGAGGKSQVWYFTGPNAEALYGGPVPLTSLGASDTTGENIYHVANPIGHPGSNILSDLMNGIALSYQPPSLLDLAMLSDLGWSINVSQRATTTTLATSATSPVVGQPVTLTATVTDTKQGSGTPGGTVTFKDGTHVLGTIRLQKVQGIETATLTTSSLALGSHSITASYRGDLTDKPSASTSKSITVAQHKTATTLSASTTSPALGQSMTITAIVSVVSPGTGAPTGTVTFKDGSTTLGTVSGMRINGARGAAFKTTSLALGTHTITAFYSGNTNSKGSTARALTINVAKSTTKSVPVTCRCNS